MKKLLIVESPAKIKTISKFLSKDFTIMSTLGHIMDLPQKTLGVSINGSIDIEYTPIENKEKVINDICQAAGKSDIVYLAPDPDREGEIIAWHVSNEILKKARKKTPDIQRITFNEITKEAIEKALQNAGLIDEKKVGAQQARRILDRWVGYQVSPVLWKKIAPGLSAGRVQSVALRLICDREEAIRAFKPEEYWSIEGIFNKIKHKIATQLTHINNKKLAINNEKDAKTVVDDAKKQDYIVKSITDKKRIKNPLAPFMTSTLQQAAFNRLGFSVKKTMQLAQQLYEGVPLAEASTPVALITYMRTDSTRIAESAIAQTRTFIKKTYGDAYLPSKPSVYDKKKKATAQDAHEAIRPINVQEEPSKIKKYLSNDLFKLYDLIWKRFVACQMKPATYAQRQLVITGGKYTFKATGSTLIFDGFLSVYGIEEDDAEATVKIPADVKENQPITLEKINPKQHFTQPPARYTEGSLVKELEAKGIGRPSTYATILNTIRARSYTTVDTKKRFTPTELGMTVTKFLVKNLPHIMNTSFTAEMEEDLDKIAQGELERDTLLRNFYTAFTNDLKKIIETGAQAKKEAVKTDITCPECKKDVLLIRFGKRGEFLGCAGYPECSFTSNFTRDESGKISLVEAEKPQLLDATCPECKKNLREIRGKFGTFVACSGYPECKYIVKTKAPFDCPQCGGEVFQKSWRGGKFWGCDNYPKCKFAVFGETENKACPQCKLPFLIVKTAKDGTKTYMCSNKTCGYKS